MDFLGLRKSEQEIGNSRAVYCSDALLYDQRFRKRISDEFESSQLLGMVISENEKADGGISLEDNTFFEIDAYQKMTIVCEQYFFMNPKYIAVTNNTLCELNRESFRYWLAGVTNRIRFGSTSSLYSLKSLRLPNNNHNQESFNLLTNQLFRNFVRLPSEVVFTAKLGNKFGLPVIANKDASDDLIEKWLSLMTWAKVVNTELHPMLCELRGSLERKASIDITSEKRSELLLNLQGLYNRCTELKATSNINMSNFLSNEHRKLIKEKLNLPRLKVSKPKDRLFFRCLLVTSIDVTNSTIAYLAEIQTHDNNRCFASCLAQIRAKIVNMHNTIQYMFKKKYIRSHFEADKCTESLVRTIESIIKVYFRRKFGITTAFGEQREVRNRMLHRILKFVRKLSEEISSSLIQSLYEYYKPALKKEHSKRILKNLLLHITWTAMNIVLSSTHFSGGDTKLPSFENSARPLDISSAEVMTGRPLLTECIRKVCAVISLCETHIFKVRTEIIGEISLPISYIYDDFSLYLKAFSGTGRCYQSIFELDSLTDGRLKTFMTELVVCLRCNIAAMEEVLGHTKDYLRFYVRNS